MKLEVDQSVRIEELNRDTIIGVGNSRIQYAALLPRKVKRHFNEEFRRQGKPHRCGPTVFAAAVILALSSCGKSVTNIVVDTEYGSYESLIRQMINVFFPKAIVSIERIGRHSPAHLVAYEVFRKRRKPNQVLSFFDLQKIINAYNKNDGRRTASPRVNAGSQVHNRPIKYKTIRKFRYVKRSRI